LVLTAAVASRAADAGTFARQIATQYHVDARHVITADIDRDGDLDVLAATDRGFMVWVNDGAGRFTAETPQHRPLVDARPPEDSWRGDESRDNETIQCGTTSIPLPGEYAHAPPHTASRSNISFDAAAFTDASRGCRIPRAPPVS
jgi:hypothetical protein